MMLRPYFFPLLVSLAACSSTSPSNADGDATGAQADAKDGDDIYPRCVVEAPCEVEIHATQGTQGDLREVQAYRLLGASADGQRLAMVYRHFGPSSWASFVNLVALSAGSRALLIHESLGGSPFGGAGSEGELDAIETQLLDDHAATLADQGIAEGANLPATVAWCAVGDTIYTDHCDYPTLVFDSSAEACEGAPLWTLCKPGSDHCVAQTREPDWDCGRGGELHLLDIYARGATLWGFSTRRTELFTDLFFTFVGAGGG